MALTDLQILCWIQGLFSPATEECDSKVLVSGHVDYQAKSRYIAKLPQPHDLREAAQLAALMTDPFRHNTIEFDPEDSLLLPTLRAIVGGSWRAPASRRCEGIIMSTRFLPKILRNSPVDPLSARIDKPTRIHGGKALRPDAPLITLRCSHGPALCPVNFAASHVT